MTRPRGFTILELVTVLVLMGVLAAVLALSAADADTDLGEQTDLLKSRIRYAQARAMGGNTPFGVSCGGGSYFLFQGTSTSNRVAFPTADGDTVALPAGISATPFLVSFDQWGVPFSNAAQTSALGSDLDISLSADGESATITVTPVTGFVP